MARDARERDAADERRGFPAHHRGTVNFIAQRVETGAIAEIDAGGATPLRLENVARQRNLAVARLRRRADKALRAAQNFADRYARIGSGRNKRRIRAIFQKPTHEIGQEIAVAADRRVDAAGGIRKFGEHRLIKRFAHAVEPLEFEAVDAAGIFDDARYGQRVVSGELRKQPVARGQ